MNKLEEIRKIEILAKKCKRCELYKYRKNVVFGLGDVNSKILFIGESPGKKEDETGIPFSGKAGKILEKLFNSILLKRQDVYITSVLKCKPPKNRNPKKNEIEKCSLYLDKQIEIINPKIIVCLGRISLKYIFKKYFNKKNPSITNLHGKIIETNGKKILPIFHPAFALYNPKKFEIIKNDFIKLKGLIC
ncbi:MAG: uracil-DNA glycosylase [Candidatus Omnitrophica bacterium]|nr:uracil-DNA glycosylase [Candidatus Omnitrophota bacterium]MCM8832547.1 uracil-DNA glycosylase [Candidatus Omnitrophota bacterium]